MRRLLQPPRFTATLHSADVLVLGFALLLTAVNLAFASRIPRWSSLVVINLGACAFVFTLAAARHFSSSRVIRVVHDWYVAPAVFFSFKELYYVIPHLHGGRDYDDLLIAADRWLFGVNPTEWLLRFGHPVLTEVLQVAYTSFYLLFLLLGWELYRRRRPGEFHLFMFTCVYGFFLSYLGYFVLPAVGPRFTLHDFNALDTDLPGVLLTPYLRWFVNAGGSVPMGVSNEAALAGTQRDVFPSGHTMMTLVLMYMGAHFRTRSRHVLYAVGALLIVATVYQRYHYVVDLAAGALFMVFCVRTSPRLYAAVTRSLGTLESRFP
ncbi:MAG: phosphatase PAP2 family protein [Bacteroidota bacterium]